MVRKRLLMLACAGVALSWGCKQNGVSSDEFNNPPASVEGENFSLYISSTMYDEAREKRSDDHYSDPFEITGVWRGEGQSNNYLNVEVEHKKTCSDRFEVIWDGRVAESAPPQLYLMIRLAAWDCDDLDEFSTDTLSLDLYEITDNLSLVKEAIFRVSNASSRQDINHDEPASNR